MWEFPISKIFARLLSEFCCNCSFKLSSASDSGEKRLDVSMSNSDDPAKHWIKQFQPNLVLLKAYPKLHRNYQYNFNMTQMEM
jgi:hypothetical protein